MQDYLALGLPVLIQMLSDETSVYTRMMTDKQRNEEDFTQCKEKIEQIQAAIHTKTASTNTGNISFSDQSDISS